MKFERNVQGKKGRELTALIDADRLKVLRDAVEYLGGNSVIKPFLPPNPNAKKNTAHVDKPHVKGLSFALQFYQKMHNKDNPPRLMPIDSRLRGEAADEARQAASEAMREQAKRGVEVGFYATSIVWAAEFPENPEPAKTANEEVDPTESQLLDGLMVPDFIPLSMLKDQGPARDSIDFPRPRMLIEA